MFVSTRFKKTIKLTTPPGYQTPGCYHGDQPEAAAGGARLTGDGCDVFTEHVQTEGTDFNEIRLVC